MNYTIDPFNLSTAEREKLVDTLLNEVDFHEIPHNEFLNKASLLIDLSLDLNRKDGLDVAINQLHSFVNLELSDFEKSLGHYFLANTLGNRNELEKKSGTPISKWANITIEDEILNFRLSLKHIRSIEQKNFHQNLNKYPYLGSPDQRLCQIFTNLGNLMDDIGRFIEGIECRENSLKIDPKHGMAMGNKGFSYMWYALFLPQNTSQKAIFYHESYNLLKTALNYKLEYDAAEAGFRKAMVFIESKLEKNYLDSKLSLNHHLKGSKNEIRYKQWCLENRLFLNTLNDLGPWTIAATDDLIIPVGEMRVDYGINCHTFFNHLKQEFVAARYLYYEGISKNKRHFSDNGLIFGETYDRPLLSLASEKIKISFRLAYSIFDKIAFFIYYYFKLDLNERDIYFRSVWYQNKKKNPQAKKIAQVFQNNDKNLPLIGLFWLSKDIYEKNTGFVDALEPDAKGWYDIRNSLEHKYFKITFFNSEIDSLSSVINDINSPFMESITIDEFEKKTLKLLKTVRNALVYLVLAINYEEYQKTKNKK